MPLNTDAFYFVNNQQFELCHVAEASALFAHRSWHEVADYFRGSAELKDQSATREAQSRTDRDAQICAIVANAQLHQQDFEKPASKAAALRNIRENRRVERDRERAAATAAHQVSGAVPSGAALPEATTLWPNSNGYIPRPIDLELLRKQREKHRKKE